MQGKKQVRREIKHTSNKDLTPEGNNLCRDYKIMFCLESGGEAEEGGTDRK